MIETVHLNNGLTVLAHRILQNQHAQTLCPVHYANRTQALRRIADLTDAGIAASLYKGSRVFYVRIDTET